MILSDDCIMEMLFNKDFEDDLIAESDSNE
jgi:hypothetical protein